MSERNIVFTEGETYHVYNRGIDKRKIFFSKGDWKHFQRLLFTCNSTKPIKKASRVQGVSLDIRDTIERGDTLVDIYAYAMMPNHFHLLVHEKREAGITKYMSKLLTAFAMYMNKKYNRTGPLMCRPFRAKHVDRDEYFRWLFAYIHLNPLELEESEWKEKGIKHLHNARKFLKEYRYSSYLDYFGKEREESLILNKEALPMDVSDLENPARMLKEYQAYVQGNPLDIGDR